LYSEGKCQKHKKSLPDNAAQRLPNTVRYSQLLHYPLQTGGRKKGGEKGNVPFFATLQINDRRPAEGRVEVKFGNCFIKWDFLKIPSFFKTVRYRN